MSNIPADLKYAKSHEWLQPAGTTFRAGETFGVVESVKAASDVYVPVTGKVVEVNRALEANPEKVNQSPYGDGWMLKLELANPAETAGLLSAEDYRKLTG